MLRANVYAKSAKTSGCVPKSIMSATAQATTDSSRSHVDRDREREDGECSGNSHPASIRGGGSMSRAASRFEIDSLPPHFSGRPQLSNGAC